ncbi:glutathione peroxidase [Nannocystis sp. SCPEA4]|uniref:glutathione peroxidase n=1 Tax=Nannocystis sp. SCPEA4 TaxID=2996787 RepID=UPI00226E197D|nr:glutathione peroxidase [Nannocystis sp. SCPEA4]MCY1063002.1 glutathione peroxidase [Nannocystis sp. SCPEA4]
MLRSLALLALVAVACDSSPTPSKPAPAEPAKAAPAAPVAAPAASAAAEGPTIDHVVETLDGGQQKFADLRGKAILVVNTASQCGFTPQYAKLQELYGRYKDRGLVVLGFPSNDFGEQEPGDAAQIKDFVASKFAVDFPMMNKVHAKGPEIAPIYKTLTEETSEGIRGEVKWNFTKFLIDPKGHVVARFESPVDPLAPEVTAAIEKVLPAAG